MSMEAKIKIIGLGIAAAVVTGCSGDSPNPLALFNGELDKTECTGDMKRYIWRGELERNSVQRGGWTMDGKKELALFNEVACGKWDYRKRVVEMPNLPVYACLGTKRISLDEFITDLTNARYDGQWNFRAARDGYERAACPDRRTQVK